MKLTCVIQSLSLTTSRLYTRYQRGLSSFEIGTSDKRFLRQKLSLSRKQTMQKPTAVKRLSSEQSRVRLWRGYRRAALRRQGERATDARGGVGELAPGQEDLSCRACVDGRRRDEEVEAGGHGKRVHQAGEGRRGALRRPRRGPALRLRVKETEGEERPRGSGGGCRAG